jgi:cell shape-determining protein MreD
MDRLNFFQALVIVLTLTFLSVGGALLYESVSNPATQPWELLGGALLCSLALMFAYFLWKQRVGRKYLQ